MKILFIGGTGVISTACSRLAIGQGHELWLLNRGNRGAFVPEGAKIINGDINNVESAKKALGDETFDAVVNFIVYTPAQIERDISLFAGRAGQYVFISSASAYQKPVANYLVTESTPLANPYWQYSRDKIACEERLMREYRENGFPFTVVRPSLTYGETIIPAAFTTWGAPYTLIDRMKRGKKIIVHGDGTSLWSITHNTDFAKGLLGLLGNTRAIAHAFHITTDEVLSWNQIYEAIGAAAGVRPELIHIPSDFINIMLPQEKGGLHGDKAPSVVFDNTKIKSYVPGFHATVTFAEGMKKTVQWLEASPERCKIDERWNALCDDLIAAYEVGVEAAKKMAVKYR